jgi:hypothetical protein
MRLGIISDTHGLLRPEVFEVFREVDRILHAGDIGPSELLEELQSIAPVLAVSGNTDDFDIRSRVPEIVETRIEGFDFLLVHGHQLGAPTPERLHQRWPEAEAHPPAAAHPDRPGGDGDESRRGGGAPVRSARLGGDPGAGAGHPSPRAPGSPHSGGPGLARHSP